MVLLYMRSTESSVIVRPRHCVTFKICQGDTVNLGMGSLEFSSLKCKIELQSVSKFIVFCFNKERRNNERSRGYTFRKGKDYRFNNQES